MMRGTRPWRSAGTTAMRAAPASRTTAAMLTTATKQVRTGRLLQLWYHPAASACTEQRCQSPESWRPGEETYSSKHVFMQRVLDCEIRVLLGTHISVNETYNSHSCADFGEQEDVDIVTVQDALLTQAPDEPSMVCLSGQQHLRSAPVVPCWCSSTPLAVSLERATFLSNPLLNKACPQHMQCTDDQHVDIRTGHGTL